MTVYRDIFEFAEERKVNFIFAQIGDLAYLGRVYVKEERGFFEEREG